MANDLAAGGVEHGPYTPQQLFAGESPIVTGNAVAATAIVKHAVCVLLAAGTISNDTAALTTGDKCVIAAQDAEIGESVPYFSGGHLNYAQLTNWPTAVDSLAKAKQFFMGTDIKIGSIDNA
jgi:prolyl-tRNA editing enzyme YbaK/EbsC (Cys-tRNA(Pro) deacylase)